MSLNLCPHCRQPMLYPCPECGGATKALRGKETVQGFAYTLRECGKGHRSNWSGRNALEPFGRGRRLAA